MSPACKTASAASITVPDTSASWPRSSLVPRKEPNHPIAAGIREFVVTHHERYSEPYAVPEPQAVVFEGVHTLRNGGEDPSRMGLCFQVGKGKFFYFQPGHETNPIFLDENVRKIMVNAVKWAAPAK